MTMAGDTLTAEDDNENMFFLLEFEVGGRGQGTNGVLGKVHRENAHTPLVVGRRLWLTVDHESDDMAPRRRYAITRNHRGQPLLAVSVSDTQRQGGVNATVTRCWE